MNKRSLVLEMDISGVNVNTDVLRTILEHTDSTTYTTLYFVCKDIRHLCDKRPLEKKSLICASVARSGHLELLKWYREQNCPWDEDTCALAAKGGHLEVLKWCREQRCDWDENTCASAAKGGHLEVLM